jgi:hypothetical protein
MKQTIEVNGAYAYMVLALMVTLFMLLFVDVVDGQELPNAPQAAVKQQIPSAHRQGPPLVKPGNLYLGSADWFREREHFKLARIIPLLTHMDWNLSFGKPKQACHGIRKSR